MSSNPFVVEGVDSATPFSGAGLLDDGASLVTSIQNKDWVSAGLSVVGVVSDVVSAALNPLGALISWGVGWILDHTEPLKSWLNELTGDSGAVTGGAQTWGNIAAGLHEGAQYLMDSLTGTLAEMESTAVNAYKVLMADVAEHINLSAQVAGALSTGLEVAAGIVQFVHDLVRDAIADVVGQAISCIVPLPPVIAGVVAKVNSWATKIGTKIDELISSFDSLKKLLNKGESLLDDITEAFNKIKRSILGDVDLPTTKPKPDTPDIDSPDVPATDSPSQVPGSASSRECTGGGEPVDMGTGWVFLEKVDVNLPGTLNLILRRRYLSSFRFGRLFGRRWASTLDEHLDTANGRLALVRWDGSVLEYPRVEDGGTAVPVRGADRWELSRIDESSYVITDPVSGLRYRFVGRGRRKWLVEYRDRADRWVQIHRDVANVPTRVVHHGGYELGVGSHNGRITSLDLITEDGRLRLVTFDYVNGALVQASGDGTFRFEVDELERITTWSDSNGVAYAYHYDEHDRCVREGTQNPGFEHIYRFTYRYADGPLPGGMTSVIVNPDGSEHSYESDRYGKVVRDIDELGGVISHSYDELGRKTAVTDQLGHTTSYEYDAQSRLTRRVGPDGATTIIEHDADGRPVRVVGPGGEVTTREFNAAGEITAQTSPGGGVISCLRESGTEAWTDAAGRLVRVDFDRAGLPSRVTDATGTTRIVRDAFGRPREVVDASGGRTVFEWNSAGKLTSRVSAAGGRESWVWDGEQNLVEWVDAAGRVTRFEYGPFDVVTARHEPGGTTLRFGYDEQRRLISVTNQNGQVWTYQRDPAGRVTAETDFDGRITTYGLDAAGQQVRLTNAAGQIREYELDPAGNLARLTADGVDITYRYDLAGRLLAAEGTHGVLERSLDQAGRTVTETVDGHTMSWVFDPSGQLTGRLNPSGVESAWGLDPAGRRDGLTLAGTAVDFELNAAGQAVRSRFDGVQIDSSYDPVGRLTTRETRSEQSADWRLELAYTQTGEVATSRDTVRGTRHYQLDPVGRVTDITTEAGLAEVYRYDPVGNLTYGDWGTTESESRGQRQLSGTLLVQSGRDHYQYDKAGRRTHRRLDLPSGGQRDWRYSWNGLDQLTTVTTPDGHTWHYGYDPLGRRTTKTHLDAKGQTVESWRFSWDGVTLVEEAHTTSAGTRSVTWENDGFAPIAQVSRFAPTGTRPQEWTDEQFDAEFAAIITDQIGMPLQVVNADGVTTWAHQPNLWGATVADPAMPLRFPGQYHDPETGLDYNVYRYYDPDNARYVSLDPLGLSPAPNPNTYPRNPTLYFDQLGLSVGVHPSGSGSAIEPSPWPANSGFLHDPVDTTLPAGTRVDRYGTDYGTFTAVPGTPLPNRSMRLGADKAPYTVFELQEDIVVQGGIIAPAFGQPGGGIQYKFPASMIDLLARGAIKKVS